MAFLVMLLPLLFSFHQKDCGRSPAIDFRESGNPKFHRKYSNPTFGYRIRLPRRVTACGEPRPQPAHGVGIILSRKPPSYLFVDASYDAALLRDAVAAADRTEDYLRNDSISIRRLSRNWMRVGSLRALRLRLEHTCTAGTFITDEMILLKRGIVYTLSLTAPKSRYRKDRQVLESIAGSFELIRMR